MDTRLEARERVDGLRAAEASVRRAGSEKELCNVSGPNRPSDPRLEKSRTPGTGLIVRPVILRGDRVTVAQGWGAIGGGFVTLWPPVAKFARSVTEFPGG
ncbi:MAG: hypothetical protein JWO38_1749 [Gemmataceae bacterium]|nr:hypothetical protein [Gemmataceae bacterium]